MVHSFQRTDGVTQSCTLNVFQKRKQSMKHTAQLETPFSQLPFKRKDVSCERNFEKLMALRVSSFMDRGSAYITHRWISSLDTIDRPHEKELSSLPKRLESNHRTAPFGFPSPLAPLLVVLSLFYSVAYIFQIRKACWAVYVRIINLRFGICDELFKNSD